ncbi:methylated-DNA--[protein]-cysteine S-methyltransferase [Candidatus Saccharibacteria bacterium]|nr:methylated-DNA--[protein]-cysteine S-methyltransferase [Candidatus Saccharibacteria bacterium]
MNIRGYVEYVPEVAQAEVLEFLEGERKEFSSGLMATALAQKGTDFQRSVWQAIAEIPYGETASYKNLAERVGKPNAVRAVGTACGRNKFAIVIPCHRVLASGGGMGGYAFGLTMKKDLLKLEKALDMDCQ